MRAPRAIQGAVLVAVVAAACVAAAAGGRRWSDTDVEEIGSLWIGQLEPVPADPTNRFADDPRAAELGRKLFFDTRLSSNGQVACATCHDANAIGAANDLATVPVPSDATRGCRDCHLEKQFHWR